MNRYISNISDLMKEIDWDHAVNKNGLMVHFGFQASNNNVRALFAYHPEQEEIVCKALIPYCSPGNRKREVAELMARYNEQLMAGCFSMDWESGLILFSVYLLTNDQAWVNAAQIRTMLFLTITESFRCLSLFQMVINEVKSPERAMSEWQKQLNEEESSDLKRKLEEGLAKYKRGKHPLFDQLNNN
jgi:hypothetical protein